MNVGTFEGGQGVNMVPDAASVGVDIRTLPGMDHQALLDRIGKLLGEETKLDVFSDMPAVWTSPKTNGCKACSRSAGAISARSPSRAPRRTTPTRATC